MLMTRVAAHPFPHRPPGSHIFNGPLQRDLESFAHADAEIFTFTALGFASSGVRVHDGAEIIEAANLSWPSGFALRRRRPGDFSNG